MTQTPASSGPNDITAQDEVAGLCSDLIRIDTSNRGDNAGPGERQAAEHVAALLTEVGLEPTVLESAPGRTSVVTRIAGEHPERPALLLHGHLDVVPADAADWQVAPVLGRDRRRRGRACVWGRGAVDMKDMDAMILAVVRQRMREGRRPPRDVVLAFLADEEAGGSYGARWLVDNHPGLFEGVTEAIGEVGGFSVTLGGQRLYLVQTAEKGMAWLQADRARHRRARLDAAARQRGHRAGRDRGPDRAARLAGPAHPGGRGVPRRGLRRARHRVRAGGVPAGHRQDRVAVPADRGHPAQHRSTPPCSRRDTRSTSSRRWPPRTWTGASCRGTRTSSSRRWTASSARPCAASSSTTTSPWRPRSTATLCDAMTAALLAEDPGAKVVPYCLSGGTDAKSFSRLGMRCFGFAPLRLPGRPGLLRHVPRRRRARPGVRPAVRDARPGRLPRPLLTQPARPPRRAARRSPAPRSHPAALFAESPYAHTR